MWSEAEYQAYLQREAGKRAAIDALEKLPPLRSQEDEPEDAFLAWVIRLFKQHGYLCYHTRDSKRSEAGYPDLTMTNGREVLFVELKSNTGKVSDEQQRWLALLERAGQKVCVWRPRDKAMILDRLTWPRA